MYGNERCWDMLQRVFDLARDHGFIGPDNVGADASMPDGMGLQLTERAASVQDSDCRLLIPI